MPRSRLASSVWVGAASGGAASLRRATATGVTGVWVVGGASPRFDLVQPTSASTIIQVRIRVAYPHGGPAWGRGGAAEGQRAGRRRRAGPGAAARRVCRRSGAAGAGELRRQGA